MGTHPWTGCTVEVVALQWTLKEARHDVQVAREFTHERTKQWITHLNVIALAPAQSTHPAMPERSPRGWGLTRRADWLFIQEKLKDLQITKPAFMHCPALLGAHPETPNQEHFNSTWEDAEEDEGNTTMPVQSRKRTSLGTQVPWRRPIGTAEETAPCEGNGIKHAKNSASLRTDSWVFPCLGKLLRKTPSLTEIGTAKWKKL